MLDSFLRGLDACLSEGESRILVALSGGADSVALLLLCHSAAAPRNLVIGACHVHHHLRHGEADRDLEFCRSLCGKLKVPFATTHLDPAGPRGRSPEDWWRQQRYALLEQQRREWGFHVVATAHTLDDQAETVLLKLLRGSGPRGLAGIRSRSGAVIRPLLDLERQRLREFLADAGQEWVEDSTNRCRTAPRGWVRWELLPLLGTRNPNIRRSLAELAHTLAADDAYFARRLAEQSEWPRVGAPVSRSPVAALPAPLRRRWLLALAERLPLGEPPSRIQIAMVEHMLGDGQPAAVDLGRRWVLRRRGELLILEPPPCRPFDPIEIAAVGECELPGGFLVRFAMPPAEMRHRAFLHTRIQDETVSWRSIRPGERLPLPDGRPIRPLLVRAGIPSSWLRAWPLLEAGGTMIWVPGVSVAAGWLADQETGMLVEMEEPWERHGR